LHVLRGQRAQLDVTKLGNDVLVQVSLVALQRAEGQLGARHLIEPHPEVIPQQLLLRLDVDPLPGFPERLGHLCADLGPALAEDAHSFAAREVEPGLPSAVRSLSETAFVVPTPFSDRCRAHPLPASAVTISGVDARPIAFRTVLNGRREGVPMLPSIALRLYLTAPTQRQNGPASGTHHHLRRMAAVLNPRSTAVDAQPSIVDRSIRH
jgi:hypothetical protein